jgi:hypothetical protein
VPMKLDGAIASTNRLVQKLTLCAVLGSSPLTLRTVAKIDSAEIRYVSLMNWKKAFSAHALSLKR